MAEGATPNLENEIAQIEKQLATKRAALESAKHDKELLHEVVQEKIAQHQSEELGTGQASAVTDDQSSTSSSGGGFSTLPPAAQQTVQQLVNVAFTKSISEASISAES